MGHRGNKGVPGEPVRCRCGRGLQSRWADASDADPLAASLTLSFLRNSNPWLSPMPGAGLQIKSSTLISSGMAGAHLKMTGSSKLHLGATLSYV